MQSRMKVWKFWWFEGLLVLELFKFFRVWRVMNSRRCYSGSVVIGSVFSQMNVMRELRETSAEILGSLIQWKDKAEILAQKLKGPEEF